MNLFFSFLNSEFFLKACLPQPVIMGKGKEASRCQLCSALCASLQTYKLTSQNDEETISPSAMKYVIIFVAMLEMKFI